MPRGGQQTGDRQMSLGHRRPGEFPGGAGECMSGTPVPPADDAIVPHRALGSVRSSHTCCSSGALPRQSPGDPLLPAPHHPACSPPLSRSPLLHSRRCSAPGLLVGFRCLAGILPVGRQAPRQASILVRSLPNSVSKPGKKTQRVARTPTRQMSSYSLPTGSAPSSLPALLSLCEE